MTSKMKQIPVYNHSGMYAREHGELEMYRASRQADLACRNAIDDAISRHYQNNSLSKDAVTEVIEAFGFERTTYVLANTIQRQDWDRRYSTANRAWADTVDVCENRDDFGGDKRLEFTLRSHPGLVNIFTSEVRKDADRGLPLCKPRASVRTKLQEAKPVASVSKPVTRDKGMEL